MQHVVDPMQLNLFQLAFGFKNSGIPEDIGSVEVRHTLVNRTEQQNGNFVEEFKIQAVPLVNCGEFLQRNAAQQNL